MRPSSYGSVRHETVEIEEVVFEESVLTVQSTTASSWGVNRTFVERYWQGTVRGLRRSRNRRESRPFNF